MRKRILHKLKHNTIRFITFIKWILFSILSGLIISLIGVAFYYGIDIATDYRTEHPWILWLLPLGGVAIVFLYRLLHDENSGGTNLVLSAIHSNDNISLRMAPLIFVATIITHLFGGSAGREGAALQIGGSIGSSMGRLFRFNENDKHIMIMCGMSAAFTALFGTPMAAAIFSIEVVSVGIMHYSALLPCVISSLVAQGIADLCSVHAESYQIIGIPDFTVRSAVIIGCLALLTALVSILFCICLHQAEHWFAKLFKNPYIRIMIGGATVVILSLLIGNQSYNGSGLVIIEHCLAGELDSPIAFLLKIILTAITIGAGYKGGEIVPTFFIGATFGCLFGTLAGFSPSLCAAIGMITVFCGVTNCPITSLLLSFELFGYHGIPYFLLSIAISYMLSGYYGLYLSQKIIYSKYKTQYINRKTH